MIRLTRDQTEKTTCAKVCVAVCLLLRNSRAAPPTILRRWVITLTSPIHDSPSTVKGTFAPGPPLAPTTIHIATRRCSTSKESSLTWTKEKRYVQAWFKLLFYWSFLLYFFVLPVFTVINYASSWIHKLPIRPIRPHPWCIARIQSIKCHHCQNQTSVN